MQKIGLLSDTHGYMDERILHHLKDCDEIWHAGDFGTLEVVNKLSQLKPLRGVFGNIDGREIRNSFPEHLIFELESLKILITHIGGYPNKYHKEAKKLIEAENPNIFICGHSHILKVITDSKFNNMLCINPGAAGMQGFHLVRTLLTFELNEKRISNLKAIELGTKKQLT